VVNYLATTATTAGDEIIGACLSTTLPVADV